MLHPMVVFVSLLCSWCRTRFPSTLAGRSNVSQTQISGAVGPRDKSFRLSGRRRFSLCLMVFLSCRKLNPSQLSTPPQMSRNAFPLGFQLASSTLPFKPFRPGVLVVRGFQCHWCPLGTCGSGTAGTFGRPTKHRKAFVSLVLFETSLPFGRLKRKEPICICCLVCVVSCLGLG